MTNFSISFLGITPPVGFPGLLIIIKLVWSFILSSTSSALKEKFNCKVGYSGHESGLAVSFAALGFGISSLERHITLDRTMYGSDQAASLEESGLKILIDMVRLFYKSLGEERKGIYPEEIPIAKKLRYWE